MIAVIADDLTGAAEIGGLGLRHHLRVDIALSGNLVSDADLLIVATDTRSMPEAVAVAEMSAITSALIALKPNFIFKKVDSVLRGHVLAELESHLQQLKLKRALLVPANPALGRTIRNGHYYLHGQPIHNSSFANDPEFAISSSDVKNMLRIKEHIIHIHSGDTVLPDEGIIVGECANDDDLNLWAKQVTDNLLPAGGSGFFDAILKNRPSTSHGALTDIAEDFGAPALFVCGSTFSKSIKAVEKVVRIGGPVSYMPDEIISAENPADALYEKWADEIVSLLSDYKKAILAINEHSSNNVILAGTMRNKKAVVVAKVFEKIAIKELLIEGGATASAIIKKLNFERFSPVKEISTGVIRMRTDKKDDLFLTLKPGSYDWPASIWNFSTQPTY